MQEIMVGWFAELADIDGDVFERLLDGSEKLTAEIAHKLAVVTNRPQHYRNGVTE